MINSQRRTSLEPGDRRHVQNASMPTADHRRQEQLGEAQDCFDIQPQHRDVVLDRNFPKFSSVAESGIVNQDIDVDALVRQFIKDLLRSFGLFQIFGDYPH